MHCVLCILFTLLTASLPTLKVSKLNGIIYKMSYSFARCNINQTSVAAHIQTGWGGCMPRGNLFECWIHCIHCTQNNKDEVKSAERRKQSVQVYLMKGEKTLGNRENRGKTTSQHLTTRNWNISQQLIQEIIVSYSQLVSHVALNIKIFLVVTIAVVAIRSIRWWDFSSFADEIYAFNIFAYF